MKIIVFILAIIVAYFVVSSIIKSTLKPEPLENSNGFKEGYMSTCNESGADEVYCECTYDFLSRRYTLPDMAAMGLSYQNTGEVPEPVLNAAQACL